LVNGRLLDNYKVKERVVSPPSKTERTSRLQSGHVPANASAHQQKEYEKQTLKFERPKR
jgi:hypothetical protein